MTDGLSGFALTCTKCAEATLAAGLATAEIHDPESGPPARFTFVQCTKCGHPAVMAQEDYGVGWDSPLRIWPEPPRFLSYAIPERLRDEAEQARRCFECRAYTASVVMVRRTLEGLCREHGINQHPLAEALKQMRSQGHLDDRLLEWSDGLRVLGNQGAHYTGQKVSPEDARDALDLAEAMLDYIYVFAAKYDRFKSRRAAVSPTGSP
jgi:Domain of unknown function (DUF4145)